jgi:hypothetical protein
MGRWPSLAAGGLALVLATGDAATARLEKLSSREVVTRVRRYVADYRPRLAELVAEEEYTQRQSGAVPATRTLVSDFAVVRGDDGMWVGFRDVWKVDGQELPDRRARAERLFGAGRLDWITARQIIEESARFNLGRRVRDFNTPVAALDLVAESRAWCCRVKATRQPAGSGPEGWTLEVTETDRPTLVRTADGRPAYAKARFEVDGGTGAIRGFTFRVGRPDEVTIAVAFRFDPAFDMWLPEEMSDSFKGADSADGGRARYTRWRRFQATARIVG